MQRKIDLIIFKRTLLANLKNYIKHVIRYHRNLIKRKELFIRKAMNVSQSIIPSFFPELRGGAPGYLLYIPAEMGYGVEVVFIRQGSETLVGINQFA